MKRIIYILLALLYFAVSANAKDWKGQWITTNENAEASNCWYCFHKTVDIPNVKSKNIYADIAADSKYWLWINGDMVVFEGGLKRGPNPNDTYYDRVNIAPYLKKGSNSIAILMWHFGKDGFRYSF